MTIHRLLALAVESGDPNLERLCREYLPLTFSRRHGDPSRPWNRFSIATKNPDGTRILNYEGNWRDIFQNWEALSLSFPGYTASMICKFANASTADGYNPYRITRDGIDWEVIDPADPWTHIGYWGDHQVIYLLKLLEILERHESATLRDFLTREIFSYADVPYRIKPYEELLKDPKETVVFDRKHEEMVRRRVQLKGSDGKLVWDRQGQVRLVNLSEKLLVSLLAKFSNFIPEAGIWLNTQRPEWNDANNALVGNGVSVVTLCYLRRFLAFCLEVFRPLEKSEVSLSDEVAKLLLAVCRILQSHRPLLSHRITDRERKRVLDGLARAGSQYREQIYAGGFSGRRTRIKGGQLLDFFKVALAFADESIRANRRPDGLYHAYNLIKLENPREIPIRRLYEMLEGQVAVLSSGRLTARESLDLLVALKQSAMYRPDQRSYLLYPNRRLPRFVEKNNIPRKRARPFQAAAEAGCGWQPAAGGTGCGWPAITSMVPSPMPGMWLKSSKNWPARGMPASSRARPGWSWTSSNACSITSRLPDVRAHSSATRVWVASTGTWFPNFCWPRRKPFSALLIRVLRGPFSKNWPNVITIYAQASATTNHPVNTEPFRWIPIRTRPAHTGARQPGLTGQVKEDILCRMGELGIFVQDGQIHFCPALLKRTDFLSEGTDFWYYDWAGHSRRLKLKPGSLAFTYCQVPIVYQLARTNSTRVFFSERRATGRNQLKIDAPTSGLIFERTGQVDRIIVSINADDAFVLEE